MYWSIVTQRLKMCVEHQNLLWLEVAKVEHGSGF